MPPVENEWFQINFKSQSWHVKNQPSLPDVKQTKPSQTITLYVPSTSFLFCKTSLRSVKTAICKCLQVAVVDLLKCLVWCWLVNRLLLLLREKNHKQKNPNPFSYLLRVWITHWFQGQKGQLTCFSYSITHRSLYFSNLLLLVMALPSS